MTRYRGVLLDVDGTLVDSNDAHAHAWVAAFAENGLEIPFPRIRRCIGMGGDKLLPEVAGVDADSALGKSISAARARIFRSEFLPNLQPFPQAEELLRRLHDADYRLAVASSAKKRELHPLLAICGADKFIEAKTSSDDADNSKPDPDIVHEALRKIELPAAQALMLGDTPYDIEAAQRAGVGAVALRCGGWSDSELAGALAIYNDAADLVARFEQSPFAGAAGAP